MLVQGIKYVRPDLLTTSPKVGFTQGETGGFLDPLIGTFLVGSIGIAIALPLGIAIAVWLSEFGRPFALARIVESTVEMIAGTPSIVLALFGTVIFSSTALGLPRAGRRGASSSAARSSRPGSCSRWSLCRWS